MLPLITLLLLLGCVQAAFATPTTPTGDFIDNKDGTVTHKTTGLTWMRCALGQTWTGSSCSGTANTSSYEQAVVLKHSFAGHGDWRVPNIAELQTLVEREAINPAINTTLFPNAPNDTFWSSSPYVGNTNYAWSVNFSYGDVDSSYRYVSLPVRLVRASQSLGIGLSSPDTDFTDNNDGTLTHKRTGLVWQRCSVGQTWTGSTCSGSAGSYSYDAALALTSNLAGHSDWRVPTANELAGIVKYDTYSPAINTTLFPNTPNNAFWSSSPYVGYSDYAWYVVNFLDGGVDLDYRNGSLLVRLVRASQSLGIGPHVMLLLHGMNSKPNGVDGAWNSFVSRYFADNCPSISYGAIEKKAKIKGTAKPNNQKTYCYSVRFGSFDADSPNKGLEDAWDYGECKGAWNYGECNNHASAGDYSTFEQLGTEVDGAITTIRKKLPNAKILLIGHSRGGLAARAFLQQPVPSENKNSVVGLITTGTPHNGTRLGRIYDYIETNLLNVDGTRKASSILNIDFGRIDNDWEVVDFLNGSKGDDFNLDARRPVIGYLADNSSMMTSLNDNKANLPTDIKYGQLIYTNLTLGNLGEKYGFTYGLFPDNTILGVKTQLSATAEGFIKGWVTGKENIKPKPSKNYMGDGIVTAESQAGLPNARPNTWKGVRHTDEPKQTAHIAGMVCQLGFTWLKNCTATAQAAATKQLKAPFIVSHDYDALVALPVDALWQDWLAVITDDAQANRREQLAVALGIKLRDSDNAAFYADVEQRLLDSHLPQLERARLAKLLAEIATPSALESLTDALLNPDALAIQTALSNAILSVADSLPEQPRRADLSAVLEAAWAMPKQNQQQLNTLALALAKLGTARGVELLLTAIDKTGATLPSAKKKYLNTAEQQASAAFGAMDEIINPDSETVLSHAFMSHRATEAVFIAAGTGLANLGREDAAQHVLQRLDELPDNAVPVGQRWLNNLSGKIDKTALRRMNKAVRMPKQRLLRQQMEEMTQ